MKSIKNILKSSLYMLILFLILSLFITIFNYFNIFNYKVINIIKLLTPLITFIFGGFLVGKSSLKNGWLEGLKLSSIVSTLLIIISILTLEFKIEYLLYIVMIITSGIFGSMIGINKK